MTELRGGSYRAAGGSGRGRLFLAATVAAIIGLLAVAGQASATKYFDSFFPNPAPAAGLGGALSSPNDIAVLQSTGQIFVSDRSNNRVQRFSVNGTFERAWGIDVVNGVANPGATGDTGTGAAAGFEICVTAAHCKTGLSSAGNVGDALRNGAMNSPQGIDVDQASGAVYVRDRGNNRVNQYTADGEFVRSWGFDVGQPAASPSSSAVFETCAATDVCKVGVTGPGVGQFGATSSANNTGLAVAPPEAPNAGEVFVSDPGPSGMAGDGNRRVLRFTVPANPTGSVTPGQPFSGVGSSTQLSTSTPSHLAVGHDGVVYAVSVAGSAGAIVVRFDTTSTAQDPDGDFLPEFDYTGPLGLGSISSLEVDPATGHLVVGRGADLGLLEFDLAGKPATVDGSHLVDAHAVGLSVSPTGLGINGVTGEYLLSVPGGGPAATGSGNRIVVLDDTGVDPAPDVELLPATGIGCNTATLRATVNPNGPTGFPTSYRFEVSKTGIDGDWTTVADDQLVGATGDGSVPVFIDDAVSGLEGNALYRVRVRTVRSPAAGTAVSSEMVFVTDPCPPSVGSAVVQHVADTSAQLVGQVNPNGVATSYWFEWGDTELANQAPSPAAAAGSGGQPRRVVEGLSALAADSVYRFRLCALNAFAAEKACTPTTTFRTRTATTIAAGTSRAYELVTPADKALRRGGAPTIPGEADRLQGGIAATDGDSLMWSVYAGVADPAAGHGFAWDRSHEVRERTPSGWLGQSLMTLPPAQGAGVAPATMTGIAGDLSVQAFHFPSPLFPVTAFGRQTQTVHANGDDGGPRGQGYYPWLDPQWVPGSFLGGYLGWSAMIDDRGQRLVTGSGHAARENEWFRDVIPLDDTVAPKGLTPPQTSGRALFTSGREFGWRPADLVNECTGAGAASTLVPARDDGGTLTGPVGSYSESVDYAEGSTTLTASFGFFSGNAPKVGHSASGPGIPPGATVTSVGSASFTISAPTTAAGAMATVSGGQILANLADDRLVTRQCGEGSPTSGAGAILGAASGSALQTPRLGGTAITAMSGDGRRVFFASPDPDVAPTACSTSDAAADAATSCPPQLFVRQRGADGKPVVRWLSRPEDALFEDGGGEPQLRPGALGNGVAFEGASRDGDVVYFRTNAPLLAGDPNGGQDQLSTASAVSWDLYRYELGASDGDPSPPDGDPGDRLTRVSAGPNGASDANTNCTSGAGDCGGSANGGGGVVRFMSDDGERAYFVTAGTLVGPGGWDAAPTGSAPANVPGGAAAGNAATRNLYLYDGSKPGGEAYRFVARLPFAASGDDNVERCATYDASASGASYSGASDLGVGGMLRATGSNCVHGSSSGDAVVFETTARLTADDTDDASDVYLYEADGHRLTRVSAPPADAVPYPCRTTGQQGGRAVTARCNGDLGQLSDARTSGAAGELVGLTGLRNANIVEGADGGFESVIFQTRLALAGGDGGDRMDVYEWRGGKPSLVSPGDPDHGAFYVANSRDGEDVFFWTEARLSWQEVDVADGDVYDARRGSAGIPRPAMPPVCAPLLGGCQGGGSVEVADRPRTANTGDGNAMPGVRSALSLRGPTLAQRKRAVRSGRLVIRVGSTSRSRVTAVATARIAGRSRQVGRAKAEVTSTRRVSIRLAPAVRERLADGRPMTVSVRVSSPGLRTRTITVRLPGAKR